MRIIIDSDSKQDTTRLALVLYHILSRLGVKVTIQHDGKGTLPSWGASMRKKIDAVEIVVKPPFKWSDYLVEDPDDGVIVKGTFVTVNHVMSLFRDGWTLHDILTTHPELSENDIRACLSYSEIEDDCHLSYNGRRYGIPYALDE